MRTRRALALRITLAVAAAGVLGLAHAGRAAAAACQTSGPVGGTYTATVCITTPTDGSPVTGATTVAAGVSFTGSPPSGIQRVIFYLDGQYLLTDYASPYTFVLPTDRFVDGSHLLEAEALLRDGFRTARAGITLQFTNGVLTPPVNTKTFTPTSGTTPPAGQPTVVAAVGDGAGGEQSEADVVRLINSWSPNLFLYLGDVYEKGSMAEFYNWYNPPSLFGGLRSITDPTIGNHEYENGVAPGYFDYWDNIPHYYSFNVGSWHIISLDSTGQFGEATPGTAQYDWLQSDLQNNKLPCKLVYYHHPVYNIGQEGYYSQFSQVWSLMAQFGVDLVLNGHDHTYQRYVPLDGNGNPAANGTTEIVDGTGGHAAGSFVTTDSRLAASAMSFGALQLTLNSGGAGYEFVTTAGSILDSGSVACHATTDTTAPSVPTNVTATPTSRTQVDLSWSPSSDNVGVTGYDVYRGGTLLAALGPQTTYSDSTVSPSTTYSYQVRARDGAGNASALSSPVSVTTPATGTLFSDGFESGDLSKWTTVNGLVVQQQEVLDGSYAARATGSSTVAYAWRQLSVPVNELYLQFHFKVLSQGANSVYIARMRTGTGTPLVTLYVSSTGKMGIRNETTSVATTSTTGASAGVWHTAQLHVLVNDTSSQVDVWLDGAKIDALSQTLSLGTTPIGRVEIGDSSTSQTYDVALDDVSYDPSPIGDVTPPSAPANVVATAPSGVEVDLNWTPSTDDVGVAAYDVYRNGVLIASIGPGSSYADKTVNPLTSYTYTLDARDAAGNVSTASTPVTITTPHLFADDFETGDLSRWTSVTGLSVQQRDVFAGFSAAEALSDGTAPASAYVQLARSMNEVDARVEFKIESQGPNSVTLLRFRTAAASAIVSAFLSSTGKLSLRDDVSGATMTSTLAPAAGSWHLLELHAFVNDPFSRVDVFLDGVQVTPLSGPTSLGTVPIGRLELGEPALSRVFDIVFDNVVADATFTGDTTPPSAPTGLNATVLSSGGVALSWTASTDDVGVVGYHVLRGGTIIADVTGTTFTDTTATQGSTYTYSVEAFDAAGNTSLPSGTATVSVADTVPPSAPTGLTATAPVAGRVDLSWTASTDNVGVTDYRVFRNGVQIADTGGPTTTYSDTTVASLTTYTYTVVAVDAAGNVSPASAPATITTLDAIPPTAPTNVQAGSPSATRVNVTWNASTDNVGVVGYQVLRDGVVIASVSGTTTSYSDLTVQPSTTYKYTVIAFDAAGNMSAPGGPATVTTRADTSAPTNPSGLTGTARVGAVDLTWNASTDNVSVTGYRVFRNNVKLADVTGLSYSDTTVVQGTSYSYTVKAFDAAGNLSGNSNTFTITVDWTAPSIPTSLRTTTVNGTQVALAWNASTDNVKVTGYRVFRNGVKLADTTNLNYTDNTVVQGATYSYTVAAFDAAGNISAQSTAISVTVPDTTPPTAPTGLAATVHVGSIALTWTASTDNIAVTGYSVFRNNVKIADVTSTSYTDTAVVAGTQYTYTVKAFDAAGNVSAASKAVKVTAQ